MKQRDPLETMEAHDFPTVRQLSVFVENRVGQLLRLTKLFDASDTRILAISVLHGVDCAICRMILDDPDRGAQVLSEAGFAVSASELVVVSLPPGKRALLETWAALLGAEINIHYTYPLLIHPMGSAAIALATDNVENAIRTLRDHDFLILGETDLMQERNE